MKKQKAFLFLTCLLCLTALLSLSLGYANSSFSDVIDLLTGQANESMVLIMTKIRLPRILACLFGGASLALAGLLLQTLSRNPLADSGILGINTGAGLAVALTIGLSQTVHPLLSRLIPLFAMGGGLATIVLVYGIARGKDGRLQPNRLIITGVGVASMISGIMVSVVSRIDQFKVQTIVQWLSGQVNGGNWQTLALFSPLFVLVWLVTYRRAHALNILHLNEATATGLGLAVQRERLLTLFLATALAALSVVLIGNITFIGLLAGHISKQWLGSDHRISIPISMLIGAILLLVADTIGRVLLVGTGVPTGILVSIIGAPYFLYLMRQVQSS